MLFLTWPLWSGCNIDNQHRVNADCLAPLGDNHVRVPLAQDPKGYMNIPSSRNVTHKKIGIEQTNCYLLHILDTLFLFSKR